MQAALIEKIEALLTPSIEGLGFSVVQIKLMDGNSRTLQIMAERPEGGISLDDCTEISHQVSALLDVEDLISGEYRLEVSSPGIDRPLRKEAEFAAYAGHLAKVETQFPVGGRKRFSGEILKAEAGVLTIKQDNKPVEIPVADIASAKLVLTEALIKAAKKSPE